MLTAVLVMGGWAFYRHDFGRGMRPLLEVGWVEGAVWGLLMIACGLVVVFHRQRLVAVVAIGAIGLVVSLAFVRLSAPDLAITQIAVEVVTLILMLLALYFLPKRLRAEEEPGGGLGRALVSIACGLTVGWLAFATMTRDFESIAGEYWRRSLPEGGGANVVNVIIVDFRGFDTYGEIMVLGIAALIIFGLISGMMRGPLRGRLARWTSGEHYSPSRHPLLMVVVTRLMLPLSLIVAAYLFVRGHQMPGGGFIAALVVSIALIMQYMASGFGWAEDQISFDYHALIGGGALVAGATGIAAMALGHPFLTSGFGHFHLPLLGDVELASAMAFDLGVFLTVVGGVMLALAQLSNLGECTRDGATNSEPMDYPHTSGQGGYSREEGD
jgi:multicomponent K+:H+ antiporter subunit A